MVSFLRKLSAFAYSKLALIAVALFIHGCSAEQHTSAFPVPDKIRQITALDVANLILEVRVNGSSIQTFTGQGLDDTWIIPITAPALFTNRITVTWIENYQNQRLVLASQTSTFTTGNEATAVTLGSNYTTNGNGYDFDSDGISNLAERIANTDPIVADSGSFQINVPEVVTVSSGCYLMGSPETELLRASSEIPHQVCVNSFAMGKYEVTFEQYDQFATFTGTSKPSDSGWGRGGLPVTNVSWQDATAYAQWLSEQTGQRYRLPTEAEWEYAARAGTTTPFSTGQTIIPDQANYDASTSYNGSQLGSRSTQSTPVGSYNPNPWRLYDMHGNQAEWTCSTFSILYMGGELSCETIPGNPTYAIRGGSWSSEPDRIRSAARFRDTKERKYFYVGFRIALDP